MHLDILSKIFGRKNSVKKDSSESSATSKKHSGVGKTITLTTKNQKAPGAQRQQSASQIITRKESVPPFEAILSLSDGEIPLGEALQKNYAILLSQNSKKTVLVICAAEVSAHGAVDNDFLTIKERCVNKEYKVTRLFAQRQLIKIVYDDFQKKSSLANNVSLIDTDTFAGQFDKLLSEALEKKVSDIHFEVRKNTQSQVRVRIHGELRQIAQWSYQFARDMAIVVYQVLANEKEVSFVETQQQSARIERIIDGQNIAIRLNTIPVSGGFDVVMRVLKMDVDDGNQLEIKDLGYGNVDQGKINDGLQKPVGVIIIAGTTGSGKSVSLSTMLNSVIKDNWGNDGPTIKVITVEDPTEYLIMGASQQGVVRKKGAEDGKNPFADAIKAAMRCDPDILMIGEVRDEHSAQLLMQAVQTGHTALTTVHAGSGIGIVARLRSLGIPDDVLGGNDFISLLIYQTLLQVVCKSCGYGVDEFKRRVSSGEIKKGLGVLKRIEESIPTGSSLEKIVFRHRDGCEHCVNGVTGRTVVAEVIEPTPAIRAAIEKHQDSLALYHHMNSGGKLIIDHAIEKILDGIADPFDVEKAVGLLNKKIKIDDLAESLGIKKTEVPGAFAQRAVIGQNEVEVDSSNASLSGDVPQLASAIFNEPQRPADACEVIELKPKAKKISENKDSSENGEGD